MVYLLPFFAKAQLVTSPAHFPQPVINGQAVAPVLNTVPAQTAAHEAHQLIHQQHQLVTSPAHFPQPVIDGQNVAPVLNTVPEQTAAHEAHLQIAQQQQLEQLKAAQQIQIAQQQQEIEAARHFGRL